MTRNRILLTSVLVLTLVAGTIGFFRARTATAQPLGIPEISGPTIPKAWGKVVAEGAYPSGGGTALVLEAAEGTVRIVKIAGGGNVEAIVLRRQ